MHLAIKQCFGLFCFVCLLLCILADQEGGGKVLAVKKEKYKSDVSFDPDTAYPRLIVTPDKKTVKSSSTVQDVADNPGRFSKNPCVLGSPGFTSGKHYWEVEYGNSRGWAVGVARNSVKRKNGLSLTQEEGIWQQGLWWAQQLDLGSHGLPTGCGKIGVLLDYEGDNMTFYNGNQVTEIKASFNGEKVFPFFYVGADVSLHLVP
ncbi:vespryn-like [Sceloporus undulatus]|uniref:vespryn-like n=1 Tax=Sceloporus undulatus TaxID=8520 RepID=UPI001C4CF7B1|nr:vespryn-like [Sceloporus undulatus]